MGVVGIESIRHIPISLIVKHENIVGPNDKTVNPFGQALAVRQYRANIDFRLAVRSEKVTVFRIESQPADFFSQFSSSLFLLENTLRVIQSMSGAI
jgi:hypothetical protein